MPDSTSAQGNAFRDSVKRLIELTPGCSNVRTEHLLGTQPVDIYYEERTSFRTLRVACECKDYERPLTKDQIARHIEPRYRPLLQNNLVDAVRIIARVDLGATAAAYVRECGFTFHTIDQLESQIVDFRQYLHGLQLGSADDGLERYYVRPLLEDGGDLQERIESWIAGSSSQPVAILAGYGMGKTSFARHLAHVLAGRALASPSQRIPILIPLSEISSEQTLEGLLGKLLAAQNRIPSYHFSIFTELNLRGRFLIILDGFDEMKHVMSWQEFQHNFTELNRLNGSQSRVLLLGRPSALLSGDEENFVLRGKRRTGNKTYSVPGAPEYQQLAMREFSDEQAMAFMHGYTTFRATTDAAIRGKQSTDVDVEARIRSIQRDPEMIGLIGRPVQARMLTDLAIDPEVQWRSFSRYELYREFVARITEREAQKPTRGAFSPEARLRFIRRVAWWVWGRAGAAGFNIVDLPDALLESPQGELEAAPEAIRRDLVSGSILEKKTADTYYFPHRSFLEFLVAEYLCLEQPSGDDLDYFLYSQTPEVRDFIKESPYAKAIAQLGEELDARGVPVSFALLELIAWVRNVGGNPLQIPALPSTTARGLLVDCLRLMDSGAIDDAIAYLTEAFFTVKTRHARTACLMGLFFIHAEAPETVGHKVRTSAVALVLSQCLGQFHRLSDSDQDAQIKRHSRFMRMVLTTMQSGDRDGEFVLVVDFAGFREAIFRAVAPDLRIYEIPSVEFEESHRFLTLTDLAQVIPGLASYRSGRQVTQFFTRYPQPDVLLPKPPPDLFEPVRETYRLPTLRRLRRST
jgi:hypothetical protein